MEFQNNNGAATKEGVANGIGSNAANGTAKKESSAKSENKSAPAPKEPQDNGQAKPADSKKEVPNGESAHPDAKAGSLPSEQPSGKPELSLDAKLKAVGDLHRKSIQRLALISRMKLLEDFEIKLIEEHDELESNPYQGCKLIIEDDKRRQFTTNTPGLIRMVSQYIFDACNLKLAEIESTIIFPQA